MNLWERILKIGESDSVRRLEETLPVFRIEVESMIASQKADGKPFPNDWGNAATGLLDQAAMAARDGDSELGWRCFKAARRATFFGLSEERLLDEARAVLREATDERKDTPTWRKTAISEILAGKDGALKVGITADDVAASARLLDEHQDNVYHKLMLLQSRLNVLTVLSVIAVGLWILAAPAPGQLAITGSKSVMDPWSFWATVVLAGVVGSIISGLTTSIRSDRRSPIPFELASSAITTARICLSALSAIAINLLLLSGLFKLGEVFGYELALSISLVAGFSDRLLLRAFEAVESSKPPAK